MKPIHIEEKYSFGKRTHCGIPVQKKWETREEVRANVLIGGLINKLEGVTCKACLKAIITRNQKIVDESQKNVDEAKEALERL